MFDHVVKRNALSRFSTCEQQPAVSTWYESLWHDAEKVNGRDYKHDHDNDHDQTVVKDNSQCPLVAVQNVVVSVLDERPPTLPALLVMSTLSNPTRFQ